MSARPQVPDRARITVLALVIPLVISVIAVGWGLSLLPQLPDPVATHWNAAGVPDGFGSATGTLWMLAGIAVPFIVGMWAIGFYLGSSASTRRLSVFLSVWFAVAMSGLLVGTLAMQRGLADASQADGVGLAMGISFGAATVLGMIAALFVPGDRPQPTTAPVPETAERLPLGHDEQAVWVRTVELPGLGRFVAGGAVLTVLLGALGLLAGIPLAIANVAFMAALTVFFALLNRWTVTIDHEGLTARTMLPRPRTHVPLDEVTSAEVTEVRPFADFGGWGFRLDMTGRVGIVVRAGEAILVHRTGGRQVVVTVDDAATGAALLNALADRSRLR